jgi:hypothetical protein
MLRTALQLAARGLPVFPCTPGGKTPACTHGCLDGTTDVVQIQSWWRSTPQFNIGVACGHVPGAAAAIFALDLDGGEAETALKRLEDANGALPPTVETITGRGRQLWFKLLGNVTVQNSEGKLALNIDVRGHHGYVIAPPSLHPTGKRYAWSVDSAKAFAEAPQWLLDKITAPANGSGNGVTPSSEWRVMTNGVEKGQRNKQLTRLTGHLLRHFVNP